MLLTAAADDNDDIDDDEEEEEEEDDEWRFTPTTARRVIRCLQGKEPPSRTPPRRRAYFVKCFTDELVGFAHATKCPVLAAAAVYDALCVNGLLRRGSDDSLALTAPHFRDAREEEQWLAATTGTGADGDGDAAGPPGSPGKEDDRDWWKQQQARGADKQEPTQSIDDAATFLSMTTGEKREWIRRYGSLPSYRIPRPREGSRALDAGTAYRIPTTPIYCPIVISKAPI